MPIKLPNFFTRFIRKQVSPSTIEVTPSALYEFFYGANKTYPNEDQVLAYESAGKGYGLYREMRKKDPELESLIQTRTRTVASKSWEVIAFDESRAAQDQAEFVEHAINRIPEWNNKRQKIIEAFFFGFSVAEKMFAINEDGFWVIADIRDRKQDYFKFGLQGELMYRKPQMQEYQEVPVRKFIISQYNIMGGNPYGTPAAQVMYKSWFIKREAQNMWAIACEKFGMPTVKATHATGISDTEKTKIEAALTTLMSDTSIMVSDNVKIELLEAMRQSAAPYETLLRYCDEKMAKLILGQTLTSGQGAKGTGSYSLGQVHDNVRDDIIQSDAEMEMSVVNTYIVADLIDFNFPPVKGLGYPTYITKYEPEKDLMGITDRIMKLVPLGMPIPVSWVREQLTIPEPVDDEPILTAPVSTQIPPDSGGSSPIADKTKPPELPEKDQEENQSMRVLTFSENAEGYMPNLPPTAPYDPSKPQVKQPPLFRERYYVGTGTVEIRDRFKTKLRTIWGGFANEYMNRFSNHPDGILDVLDDLIAKEFTSKLARPLSEATERTIRYAGRDLARQLAMRFNDHVFKSLTSEYLKLHAYDKGLIEGIGATLKDLLSSQIEQVFDAGGELSEMIGTLRGQFDELAAWKVDQIAVTEVRAAANWASIEMGRRSGQKLEAWFIVDPASCAVCHEIASRNPYTLNQAQKINLPHPNCNDYWAMTARE